MTYAELRKYISLFTPEQLKQDVTIYVNDMDEFYPVEAIQVSDETNDVLDSDHIFLVV